MQPYMRVRRSEAGVSVFLLHISPCCLRKVLTESEAHQASGISRSGSFRCTPPNASITVAGNHAWLFPWMLEVQPWVLMLVGTQTFIY